MTDSDCEEVRGRAGVLVGRFWVWRQFRHCATSNDGCPCGNSGTDNDCCAYNVCDADDLIRSDYNGGTDDHGRSDYNGGTDDHGRSNEHDCDTDDHWGKRWPIGRRRCRKRSACRQICLQYRFLGLLHFHRDSASNRT